MWITPQSDTGAVRLVHLSVAEVGTERLCTPFS